MAKRIKILLICTDIDNQRNECLGWACVLEEHLGKKAKANIPDRRLETPFAIIDFDFEGEPKESYFHKNPKRYGLVIKPEEDDEKILRLAIGEESIS